MEEYCNQADRKKPKPPLETKTGCDNSTSGRKVYRAKTTRGYERRKPVQVKEVPNSLHRHGGGRTPHHIAKMVQPEQPGRYQEPLKKMISHLETTFLLI